MYPVNSTYNLYELFFLNSCEEYKTNLVQKSVQDYRFGFNGKENDNEVKGTGNWQDYGLRLYDPRLGRFPSVDPLTADYPWYTPFQFAGNNPIKFIDLDGGEPKDPGAYPGQGGEAPEYSIDRNTKKEVASAESFKWIWNNNTWGKANLAVTQNELRSLFPNGRADHLLTIETAINLNGATFGITSYDCVAHLLAQIGHETGGFTKSATTEGGYYKTLERVGVVFGLSSIQYKMASTNPSKYLKNEVNFLNMAYANKLGNGNEASGDGYLYRGRGYIQLTGQSNYAEFNKFYQSIYGNETNLLTNPGLIGTNSRIGMLSALFYFREHAVPAIRRHSSFTVITKTINAKAVGLAERKEIYNKASQILK